MAAAEIDVMGEVIAIEYIAVGNVTIVVESMS